MSEPRGTRLRQDVRVSDVVLPWPGSPSPLGATADAEGTNFAMWTDAGEVAEVEVCLFDDDGAETR